jgi:hypothetical protein
MGTATSLVSAPAYVPPEPIRQIALVSGQPTVRIPAIGRSMVNVMSRVLAPAYVPRVRIRRIVPVVGATTTCSTLARLPMTAIVMSQTA